MLLQFEFKGVVNVDYEDDNGDEKTIPVLLYPISLHGGDGIGFSDDTLNKAIKNMPWLTENEIDQIYNYFEANGGSYDDWYNMWADKIFRSTGLTDTNGKLIFEGDIVELYDKQYVITWSPKELCFLLYNKKDNVNQYYEVDYEDKMTIIGNTYLD